jgi:hypothetical protein
VRKHASSSLALLTLLQIPVKPAWFVFAQLCFATLDGTGVGNACFREISTGVTTHDILLRPIPNWL